MSSPMAMATSYWCYRCSRFVRVWDLNAIVCPECDGGFLEAVEAPPRLPTPPAATHRRILAANAMYMIQDDAPAAFRPRDSELRFRRSRRTARGDRSPFNPVIVLRGPSEGGGAADPDRTAATGFDLYYDDGAGSGLRPLPGSMSDFLMGSGFDRLLDQIAQIDINGAGGRGCEHPPASKAAIESMPTVEIAARHISMDSHCAVCKDPFELGTEAREMPCKHIYHRDCILPWLALRNSCPVCRREMPTDVRGRGSAESDGDEPAPLGGTEEDTMGLTIWRLPGGGFAVGRFSGGRAGEREPPVVYTEMDGGFNTGGERELPVVYTEMDGGGGVGDGGFNTGGAPRRISWTSRGNRSTESRGIGRVFRNFFSFFGRRRSSSSSRSSSDSAPSSPHRSRSSNAIRRASLSRSVSGAAPVWH